MGKQRTTVTTCDGPDCDEHYFGSEPAPGWIEARFTTHGAGTVEVDKTVFHDWLCVAKYIALPDAERPASGEDTPEGE